jgi:hypothetical protein
VIRDELRRQGQDETRERMIETGNAIREQRGPGGWQRSSPSSCCPTATT